MIEFILAHPYLTIWVALILMFERAMYCGYVVDDDSRYKVMQSYKHMLAKREKKTVAFLVRFLHEALYGAGLFKNAMQEHLFTLIIHGINCSLIYNMSGSLLAALLYLVNPINNQTVLWLNGRRYAISVLAVLVAWNFWWTAPLMAGFCAWLHVSGMPFPLLFLWTPYAWAVGLLGGIVAIGGFKRARSVFDHRGSDFKPGNENLGLSWRKAILYIKTIGYHFFNCIVPLKLFMYHDFLYYFSQTESGTNEGYSLNKDFWTGLAAVGLLAYLIAAQHSVWAFWFVLFISPWCNVRQVTMNASDRYCSLANVGLMCLVAEYALKIPTPYREAVICGLGALYIIKYAPLFLAYRNVENFHLYHIYNQPDIINPRFFLSKIYLAHKDPHSAFAIIKQGLRYRPYDFKLLLGLMECFFALGKPKRGLMVADIIEKHIPYGEAEDTMNLLDGIRKQFAKEYDEIKGLVKGRKVFHNNGKPIVKHAGMN